MASILFNVTHGPENPTLAALAFNVATAALDGGHTVTIFLAGDAVPLIRDAVLDALAGLGTGNLRERSAAGVARTEASISAESQPRTSRLPLRFSALRPSANRGLRRPH